LTDLVLRQIPSIEYNQQFKQISQTTNQQNKAVKQVKQKKTKQNKTNKKLITMSSNTATATYSTTTVFTDTDMRKAEGQIKRFLFGRENDDFLWEGGIVEKLGLPRSFYSIGIGVEFFSNKNRGDPKKLGKTKGDAPSTKTKAKNPYEAVEITYKKTEGKISAENPNKKEITNIKIDATFGVNQLGEMKSYLLEKFVWLKLYEDAKTELMRDTTTNDKGKTPFEISGMADFKLRFAGKEHIEELKNFTEEPIMTTNVRETEGRDRKKKIWGFTLEREESKSGVGGGSKTSYKSKYEDLLKFVKGGVSAEQVAEYLASQEVPKSRSPSPEPTTTPEPPTTEVVEEIVEEPKKKKGRPKGKKNKSQEITEE